MTRGVLTIAALWATFLSVGCGNGPVATKPEGTWFKLTTLERISDPVLGAVVTELPQMPVQGSVFQEKPGATGTVTFFSFKYSDVNGVLYIANPRVPAIWRFWFLTGPCGGSNPVVSTVDIVNGGSYNLVCNVFVSPARDYGFLNDGTKVYTGGSDKLLSNQRLNPNQERKSADGQYRLIYQSDGNLVLYSRSGTAIWASNTAGRGVGFTAMQSDGNLVVYNNNNVAVWASHTSGRNGAFVEVQNNRCALMYYGSPQNYLIPWGTSTCQ